MKPDYNYSFASEKAYGNLHERYEDAQEEQEIECPECEGQCTWSSCCGEPINDGICTDCKNKCEHVECPKCKGEGTIIKS